MGIKCGASTVASVHHPNQAKTPMGPLDALWHLLNFLAPAVGVGALASALAKLFWRRDLRGTRWLALWAWCSAAGLVALVAGLVLSGHDGRMTTYAALVAAMALAIWWRGFVRR
jgi:hypothetical protein